MRALVVGSVIGKRGSIGARYTHIQKAMQPDIIVSRTTSLLGNGLFLSTITGVARSKLKSLKYRFLENIFRRLEYWCFYVDVVFSLRGRTVTFLWLRDPHPLIIQYYKKRGAMVVIDLAIMTQQHVREISPQVLKNDDFINKIEQKGIELADYIICPSSFMHKWLIKNYPKKQITPINFGVTLTNRYTIQQEPRVAFIGINSERKGVSDFLKIAELHTDIEFLTYGNGFKNLKKLHNLHHNGFCDQIKFNEFGILLLPTFMEGMSKAVLEALCHGCLVVTTPQSGLTKDIPGVFICKAGNIHSINDALCQALEKLNDLPFREKATYANREYFSSSSYETRLKAFLNSVEKPSND